MTRNAHTISPSRDLEEITVPEQAPAGLEYKTLALAEVPLRLQVKSVTLGEPAGPGTNGAVNAPYEYVDDDGNHIGVAESFVAVTGVRDKVGDIIPAGSFKRTLSELEPKACLGHDWNRPIGYPESIEEWLPGDSRLPEKKVDGTPWPEHAGVLRAVTRYNLDTEDGRRAYSDAKFFGPQRTAWSIGYVPSATKTRRAIDPHTNLPTRYLFDLDLFEYSQVLHGAHPMALSQSIKSGQPDGAETKARYVQDQSYWGYPKGTPIRPGMRPRGATARRLRQEGRVPSTNQGVTTEAPKPEGGGIRGTRRKPDDIAASANAEGLFPEEPSEARVRAEGAQGKDEEHVANLAKNAEGILDGEPDENIDKAFRGLLKEGITPNELREDLGNVADNPKNDTSSTIEQDEIDDLVEDYTNRYNALAKRQSRQRRGEPEEAPEGGPAAPEGAAPEGEPAPADDDIPEDERKPELTADGLMMMSTRQQAAALAEADDETLAALDDEMTRRAAALGRPGVRSKPHQAVVAEREKRAAAGPADEPDTGAGDVAPEGEPGEPGGETDAGAGAATPDGRPLAELDDAELETEVGEARQAMAKLRQQEAAAKRQGRTPVSNSGTEQVRKRATDAEAELGRRQQTSDDARRSFGVKPGETDPDMQAEQRIAAVMDSLAEPGQWVRLADLRATSLSDDMGEDELTRQLQRLGKTGRFTLAPDPNGRAITPADRAAAVMIGGDENHLIVREPDEETPEGTEPGTPEGTNEGVDNADGEEIPGDEPSPVDGEEDAPEDIGGDIAPDAGAADPSGLPGPEQVPPRSPLNESGDAYDDDGNLITGNSRFTRAENDALGALADGDELGLTDALEQLREGNFVQLTMADGTPVRRSETTASLASELIGSDPAEARRRILEWATTGDGRFSADTQNQHWQQVAAFDELTDDELDAEEARLNDQRDQLSGQGLGTYDTAVWENGIALRALAESRRKRADGTLPGDDAEPDGGEPDGAVITADEIADAEELADTSHGVREADDGVIEVDEDVAQRQERVAGLLNLANTGAGLDLSDRDDNQLRSDRADVVAELRLQTYLEARRRKQDGVATPDDTGTAEDTATGTGRRASGETTTDEDEGKPEPPPGPPTRPGVAGAAEDFADALESGDEEAITRTRARLASSLRRSRSDTDAVKALRSLMDGPADPSPEELRAAAEAVRADARARRNENARNRRTARRFERERLRSLLGQIESEMSNRGLDYDTAPEDFAAPDNDGGLPGGAANPSAGVWTQRTERTEWSGQETQVHEVSGSHYRADIYTPANRRSTYEWTITDNDGNTVAHGSGDASDPAAAQGAVEIALATQAKLGNLPADATLPTSNLPTDSSRRPVEEVAAAFDTVRERLSRPGRPVNPVTGDPDPLSGEPVRTRPATRRAFDDAASVRAHLEARNVARRTGLTGTATTTVPLLDKIRWDDVTLSPGGQFMVTTLSGDRQPSLMSTTHGLTVHPSADGIAPDKLTKADLMRIGSLLETMRDDDGRGVDWTAETGEPLTSQMHAMRFGQATGQDAIMGTALRTLAMEKLRAGKWNDKLVAQVSGRRGGSANVTNWTRRDYVRATDNTLSTTIGGGFGRKADADDKQTLNIARGAELLSNMGAPDAAAVLLRRRATELREKFGEDGAITRGTPLLENLAIGYLGMHSPVRSPGERAVNLRMGERISLVNADDDSVRNLRALSPMRQEGTYGGSVALAVDESTGQLYDVKIGNGMGGGRRISFYNRETAGGRGYPEHAYDLGSSAFAVTGPGETVPTTREELREIATADAGFFGDDVLDAAADTLPENAAERDRRRGSAPDGERPPRRTSPRAPRRRAPTPDTTPVPGQAHLADTQARQRTRFMGGEFSLAEGPSSGGFASLDSAREWARQQVAAMDPDDYAPPRGGTGMGRDIARGVTPGYMVWRIANEPDFIEPGGARLSPGGHFIITKDHLVVHARTGGAVWGMGGQVEGSNFSTRDSAMAVADYLERGRFTDGRGIDWAAPRDKLVKQTREALGTRAVGEKLEPGSLVARAAITDMLGGGKAAPKADDLASLRTLVETVNRNGGGIPSAPNPDAFLIHENRVRNNRYHALAGARVQGADMLPANSKAGASLAKKVRDESQIAELLGQVAPLDAVRRLNRVADAMGDDAVITDTDGQKFFPGRVLRDLAKQITNTWDADKPSPLGRLLRNNTTGTIRPTRAIEVESQAYGREDALQAGEREAERLTRILGRYPIRMDRDDQDNLRVRFGATEIVNGPTADTIRVNTDGSIEIKWPSGGAGRMRLYLPPGSWDFSPDLDTGIPDAGGVGTGGNGEGREDAMAALEKLAQFREQSARSIFEAIGTELAPGKSATLGEGDYDAAYGVAKDARTYMELGDFDRAKSSIRMMGKFYRDRVKPGFDVEELENEIDMIEVRDDVLAEAAPFSPAVGGNPQKRAAVNELMFEVIADSDPTATKALRRVTLFDGGIEGAKPNTLADYNLVFQTMRVAGTALDNPDEMQDQNSRWFSQSSLGLLKHVLSHEYGHHLHNMLIKRDSKRNDQMMIELAEAMGVTLTEDERNHDPGGWVGRSKSTIITKVGTYAGTNHYELVAELFTEWRGKKENSSEYAQIVGRYLGNPNAQGGTLSAEAPPAPGGAPQTGDQQRADREARTEDYFGAEGDEDAAEPEADAEAPAEPAGEVIEDDDETADA
jgi:hypothetical protein